MFGSKDPHHPGTQLGSFHVTAARTSNGCGEGALGTTGSWEFDVKLARQDGQLFWDNGVEIISGVLAADHVSFSFQSGVAVDMRTEDDVGMPPCSVGRTDAATGVLDSPDDPVHGFTGTLGYSFAPTADSQCDDLVSPLPGKMQVFAALPCAMAFDLDAVGGEEPD